MKIKHIIALCLVLTIVLPSTALAASNQQKVNIYLVNQGSNTVTASYALQGATEQIHTFNFGDGFTCHCKHRTHTYNKSGTYKICISLETTGGKTLTACRTVTV